MTQQRRRERAERMRRRDGLDDRAFSSRTVYAPGADRFAQICARSRRRMRGSRVVAASSPRGDRDRSLQRSRPSARRPLRRPQRV